jgi:hypothetical protein
LDELRHVLVSKSLLIPQKNRPAKLLRSRGVSLDYAENFVSIRDI